MESPNKERLVIKIMKELANELNFKIDFLCYNWLVRIQTDYTVKHIMGYDWEINSSTAQLIAKDKSACYEILASQKIPSVEHQLFLGPQFQNYIGENGTWKGILAYAEKHAYKIVCKSNTGTGGNEVFKITNQLELETAVHSLFSKYRGICLCPFYDITTEYRVIILKGVVQLVYAKQKPQVTGDGQSTVLQLVKQVYGNVDLTDFDLPAAHVFEVLEAGRVLELGWKHNLGKGAKPVIIDEGPLKNALGQLAVNAAKAVNINFASVDIVDCNNQLLVMEINSGVMTENFAQESEQNYRIAKAIYKNALAAMLY